jgi:hypothetical protein
MIELQRPSAVSTYWGMINDQWRNSFFQRNLNKIAKDQVVLDVGAGTGILSAYALDAGAKFVYAVEQNKQSAEMTQFLLSQCFDQSRFKVINCNFWSDSIDQQIPNNSIDIFLSETAGPGLFDQGMIQSWECAKPLLKETAISLPDRLHCDVHVWNSIVHFDQPRNPVQLLDEQNLLMPQFANAIKEFLKQETHPLYYNIWTDLKDCALKPDIVHTNVVDITKDALPYIDFLPNQSEDYMKPCIEFELDLTAPGPKTLAVLNKMSFGSDTIYLQDAPVMPWKFSPTMVIPNSGTYRFNFNTNLALLSTDKWVVTKVD